ncbi:hypothetical protein NHX12_008812 [Muraenolepis orangiensis]|uniref:Death domain-containing protein n=1 Tax=Muraenolepis orangiensis TaxID=630683 RepID=A0A9Q0DM09_9TELE|nr:hypothetical protein NHX12_008812 [Muraenolepis orangiensis]
MRSSISVSESVSHRRRNLLEVDGSGSDAGTSVTDSSEEDEEDQGDSGDCEHKMAVKPRRTTGGNGGRKRSSSASEEEVANKKCFFMDESDGNKKTKDLSDKQLLRVAETLGHEWEKVAIYLELKITDLDNIKAERTMNVSMQKMRMLVQWRKQRPPGEATAQHLLEDLKDLRDLSCDAQQLLKGNILHTHARTHTHTHLFITSYRPCVQLSAMKTSLLWSDVKQHGGMFCLGCTLTCTHFLSVCFLRHDKWLRSMTRRWQMPMVPYRSTIERRQ